MKSESILTIKKKLKDQGFIVIKNFIAKKKINLLIIDLINLFLHEMNLNNIEPKLKLIDSINFHNKLINYRNKDPEGFSNVYNIVKGNSSLISILNDKNIIKLASKILETKESNIWNGEFQFRMDSPTDKRNSLDWHQDAGYYKEKTTDGSNGIVMWVAISKNIYKKNGAINVCPGSHKEGVIVSKNKVIKTTKYKPRLKTITRKLDNKYISKYTPETVESNRGDLIVMDLRTFHKSGFNRSPYIRFSTLNRIFDTKSKAWPRKKV